MGKKSEDFYNMDLEMAQKLAQSDAARQLFALLQSGDQAQLQQAMNQAAAGNMGNAKQILQQMVASGEAQRLIKQLREDANG